MQLIKQTSTMHTGYLKGRDIRYIVLHYTAGTSSKQGSARAVASMFANPNNRAASADFIVDDVETVQYNPDILNRYTYSVGGSKYSVKYNSLSGMYYGKCKNNNSISIEMCSSKGNKKSISAEDTDWYLTSDVVERALELTLMLMRQYNIPRERVITHNFVTGKPCPQPWTINERALSNWYAFQIRLKNQSSVSDNIKEEEPDMTQKETQALVDSALVKNKAEIIAQISVMMDGMKPKVFVSKEDVPEWGKKTVEKLLFSGALNGDDKGNLNLSVDLLRMFVVLDRLGKLD